MKRFLPLFLCLSLLLGCILPLTAYATEQTDTSTAGIQQNSTVSIQTESTQEESSTGLTDVHGFTQTCLPKSASYTLNAAGKGQANGTFYMEMPLPHNASTYTLYWGDAQGNRLAGYSALHRGEIFNYYAMFSFTEPFMVPDQAACLLIYTKGDTFGESPTPYKLDLPAYTPLQTGKKINEFVVVSDLHLGKNETAEQNFIRMLKDIKAVSPGAMGIVVAGDAVDAAHDNYYALLKQLHAQVPDAPPIYLGIGEHEYLTPTSYEYQASAHAANLNKFLAHAKHPMGSPLTKPYYTYYLGSQTMVFIGADTYENGNAAYSDEQLKWLDQTLKSSNSQRPVFVFMHQPLQDTLTGTTGTKGYDDVFNSMQVKAILDKYSNAVIFSGHTHRSMQEERTMYRFTGGSRAFNAASVASLLATDQLGNNYELTGSQGYYVTVYENAVMVRGRDFSTGEWIPQACYLFDPKPDPKAPETPTSPSGNNGASGTTSDANTEPEEPSLLSELAMPLVLLACMTVIVFIFVFRKPKDSNQTPSNNQK